MAVDYMSARCIEARDLPPEIAGQVKSSDRSGLFSLAEVERRHVLRVLEELGGNRKETARVLGIGTNTLWRKLKQFGIGQG